MAQEKSLKEYAIKARLYRFMSILFVTLGIFIFCIMYIQNVEGQLLSALKDPMVISIFLVPFLPAAVLSFLADKAEKKYAQLLQKEKSKK